ncbi:type II toxin-antitoxin system RelE family toxin [Pseudoscardovia radai]|uniref:type II toxin-antitoxin system RelE family toxin n=1 Tax=Pseudoscardovia radai TaxID=987066 RepID=UPI0039918449
MTGWDIKFNAQAERELRKLREPTLSHVRRALEKVATNPLPSDEGGYGKPLGGALSGYLKIKLRGDGIRIVYELDRPAHTIIVLVIGRRDNGKAYRDALDRI